ncbi:hypothetical protein ICW40_01145 [Actinotalea ferrariae]|uniref:hypothetical protein n=1 Tax=Actinotalea ferrariae TaxID=1386098 RepID=UPI001C8CE321|nr:hypothetical protein [Actinotalea ferrariae]MBX9243411.1 hypothetical protein [Actinotalea ferrariae]
MATTLTATPQPATASVLLKVTADAASAPTTVLDLDAPDIWAERSTAWLGLQPHSALIGDAVVFTAASGGATIVRYLDPLGLIPGQRYRADLTLDRSADGDAQLEAGNSAIGFAFTVVPIGSGRATYSVEFTAGTSGHELRLLSFLGLAQFGLVRLRVSSVPTGYEFGLLRSDTNGIRSVRLFEGQDIVDGSLIVTDYEAALDGPITYTITTTDTVSVTTSLDDVADPWLMVPVMPQYSEPLALVTGYVAARQATTTVHEVINREDPVVTLGRLRLRTGTLTIWAPDFAAAQAVAAVYGRGEVVMLRQAQHPGMDMYHACTGTVTVTPQSEDTSPLRWRVTVDYTEVQPPTAALAGALGWDYVAALQRNPTYGASRIEFPTYAERAIGPLT